MATHEPLLPALYERDREPALQADDGGDIEVSDD